MLREHACLAPTVLVLDLLGAPPLALTWKRGQCELMSSIADHLRCDLDVVQMSQPELLSDELKCEQVQTDLDVSSWS